MSSTIYLVIETNNRDDDFEIKYWSGDLSDCQNFLGDLYYELLNESDFSMVGYTPNELLEYIHHHIQFKLLIKIAQLSTPS